MKLWLSAVAYGANWSISNPRTQRVYKFDLYACIYLWYPSFKTAEPISIQLRFFKKLVFAS